jgi:hypothetical protein
LLKHLSIRPERELAAAKPNGAAGHRAGGAAES